MKAYEYIIKITSKAAERSLEKLEQASGQARRGVDRVKNGLERAAGAGNRFKFSLNGVSGALAGLGLGLSAMALMSFGQNSLSVAADAESLKNALVATSGSVAEADKNLAFLDATSKRLGLSLSASQNGFKTLSGAMMGTKLQGQATREIFESVSYGAAAMGLTAETTEGAFLALGQMMSKGKVSAEELNGQLGERIPGALGIAARAMGKTKAELLDMMQKGQLMSEDFLPKFAAEMKKTFQTDAEKNANSMRAKMNRMENSMHKFKIAAGNALAPLAEQFYILATRAMEYITPMLEGIKNLIIWLREHKEIVYGLAAAVGVAVAGFGAFILVTKGAALALGIYNGVMAIARIATIVMAGKMGLLNAVMTANPIGLVVTAIGALVGAFVWAYNKSEGFRIALWLQWETAKAVFNNIGKLAKEVFGGLGDLWDNLFDSDGRKKALDRISGAFKNFKEQVVSDAFQGVMERKMNFEGIKPPYNAAMADAAGVSSLFGDTTTGGGTSGSTEPDKSKEGIDSITGGGKKMVNVTVNVAKLNDGGITVNSTNLQEGVGEIEDKFMDMLTRVLGSANYAAAQ